MTRSGRHDSLSAEVGLGLVIVRQTTYEHYDSINIADESDGNATRYLRLKFRCSRSSAASSSTKRVILSNLAPSSVPAAIAAFTAQPGSL